MKLWITGGRRRETARPPRPLRTVTTPSRKTLTAGIATIAISASLAGCSFDVAKTGVVRAGASDVVTVLPLTFGSVTTLFWDEATLHSLDSLGLSVAPEGSAVAQNVGPPGVDFPITTGYVEVHRLQSKTLMAGNSAGPDEAPDLSVRPGWVQGSIYHEGSGLTITGKAAPTAGTAAPTAGATGKAPVVTLTDFVVDPGNSVLYATVNGMLPQVPLLSLDGSRLRASQHASGAVGGTYPDTQGAITLNGTVATLTPQAAQLLDSTFKTSAVTAGTELGTVEVAVTGEPVTYTASPGQVTAISRLTGQATTLTLTSAAASALSSLGITPAATGAATLSGDAATFPITGGMVAIHANKSFSPGYVVGSILHQSSGLAFTDAKGTTVATGDFVVDPGNSELFATVNGARNVPFLYLDGAHLTVSVSGGTVTLDGTVAELTDQAAQTLNSAFGTSAFRPGMAIGTVHLVARGEPGS
jgi:ribosomal protein S11